MADISKIFGGAWSPPNEKPVASPEDQLRDAMRSTGIEPPEDIYFDGKIHRFRSGTKGSPGHSDKPGWYLVFGDGIPAGRFGCWRAGVEVTWRADVGRTLSEFEEMAHARRLAEAKTLRDAEIGRQHQIASDTVEKIWLSGGAAHPDHPYLKRKGIQTHGCRTTGDGRLMVPLYGVDGTLSTLQYIDEDGGKLYHPGGKSGGKFWMLGTMDEPGTLYIAEGFATAATIYEATSRPCVVSYSASNLVPVTEIMREMYGTHQDIVIVADHDKHGVGQRYADQASAKYGARVVIPPIEGMDANDYAQAGHDLASLLLLTKTEWLIAADDFSAHPAPISWLVKRWLQNNALIMVHGPSGGGKTFVVLDWCLRIASGSQEWCGHKVKTGNVVYLAGEGHHGLRGRVAAWKHHHRVGKLAMWLSKDGCDLNTPTGYMQVVENLRGLSEKPTVIVVDTLHRFLAGDENSAQDAKTMLDACNKLMNEFSCSVILVHHTGVSEEAQHRARGSSAWRGALDIEISVVPGKDGVPMQIVQRKSKDSELADTVHVELKQVTIPGWYDEDNQPVTSAVIVQADAQSMHFIKKTEPELATSRKRFERAWIKANCEIYCDSPYLSRSAMIDFLINNDGFKPAKAESMCKPDGSMIGILLNSGMIQAAYHGWIVVDNLWKTSMNIMMNSD